MYYNWLKLIKEGFNNNSAWEKTWRNPELKKKYDVIIIGGGGHGLATAFYLAKEFNIKNIAVLEKKWIGGGNVQVAPQETEISSYVIGGVKQDMDENTLSGMSL